MYESYYDEVQPYFRPENLQMLYMDLDSFELSIRTENTIVVKSKIETPKIIYKDEFVALRNKMYAFKCGDNCKNKFEGICNSQSENVKFWRI